MSFLKAIFPRLGFPRTLLSISPTPFTAPARTHRPSTSAQQCLGLWQPQRRDHPPPHRPSPQFLHQPRRSLDTTLPQPNAKPTLGFTHWGFHEQQLQHQWGQGHSDGRTAYLPLSLLAALASPSLLRGMDEEHDPEAEGVRADIELEEVAWRVLRELPGAGVPLSDLTTAVQDFYTKLEGLIPTPGVTLIHKAIRSARSQRKELNYDVSQDQLPLLLNKEPSLLALNSNPALAVKPESLQILREFLELVKDNTLKNYGGKQYTFLVRSSCESKVVKTWLDVFEGHARVSIVCKCMQNAREVKESC